MRCVSIVYLPSETDARFNTVDFVENLAANRPAGDLLLFSDHPQPTAEKAGFSVVRLQKNFDTIPTLQNARIQKPGSGEMVENRAALNNLIFLTALRLVERQGYSHFCYLESDCRVKNHPVKTDYFVLPGNWDTRLFSEFFNHPRHLLMAGSVMCYNVANQDRDALERYEHFLIESKAQGRRLPIPPYGFKSAPDDSGACIFTNGGGAVFSVEGLKLLFPELQENNDIGVAAGIWAWDMTAGARLWKMFGKDSWLLIGYLPSVVSQYGDVLSTEKERLRWLDEWAAVTHQHKGKK